ncbi:hypothetical protein [Aneurinibacillus uraniidurans]|uniref:hypothetical protein n=1 Tax=Aneurinibacillus uraniidurans TaxID=2966586 RepID=UPI00234AF971|nr:hypothetical protein [Aneurinibacillus sp. B1]WCN36599.1 hypothetical protein PO771_12020 [Aneurinibacillus sp. B1]
MKTWLIFALLIIITATGCSNKETNAPEKSAAKPAEQKVEQQEAKSTVPLETKKVLSDKVEILLPKKFTIMSDEMAKVKYPSGNRPTLIYTDESGSVNVALNHTQNPITNGQIPEAKDQIKKLFTTMYPNATWYSDTVEQINNKNVGVLELLTPAADGKIYNLMFYTELEGKMLLVTFNCKEQQMEEWKPVAKQIMKSINTK